MKTYAFEFARSVDWYLFNAIRSASLDQSKFGVTENHLEDFKNVLADDGIEVATTIVLTM